MQNLSYGFFKPENPDTGDIFYPRMSDNMQKLNDHNHDGVNSAPLTVTGLSVPTVSWSPIGGNGMYAQTLTLPAGRLFDTTDIWFRSADGNTALLDVSKASANTFTVVTNKPTEAYKVFYR